MSPNESQGSDGSCRFAKTRLCVAANSDQSVLECSPAVTFDDNHATFASAKDGVGDNEVAFESAHVPATEERRLATVLVCTVAARDLDDVRLVVKMSGMPRVGHPRVSAVRMATCARACASSVERGCSSQLVRRRLTLFTNRNEPSRTLWSCARTERASDVSKAREADGRD